MVGLIGLVLASEEYWRFGWMHRLFSVVGFHWKVGLEGLSFLPVAFSLVSSAFAYHDHLFGFLFRMALLHHHHHSHDDDCIHRLWPCAHM